MVGMQQRASVITTGSTLAALTMLTLPSLLTQIGQTIGWLGEAYFVGQLGTVAVAAIGAVGQVGWVLMVVTMMVGVGATTLVAQRWGAGDVNGAREVTVAAFQQSVLFSLPILLLWFFRHIVWTLLGVPPSVQRLADAYFAVALASFPVQSVAFSLMAVYRGMGDMVTPLWATFVGVVLQLAINALLVPRWGIGGAGMALALSRLGALGVLLWRFHRCPLSVPARHFVARCWGQHRSLLALGIPAGLQSLLWSLASMLYFTILAHTPSRESAIAALTVGLRIEAIAFMPGIAFGMAAQTLVGQCVGAKQWRRAEKGAWQAAVGCAVTMGLMALVFFVAADWLAMRFAKDALTRHYIAAYLRINALSEPLLGISMSLGGALRGLGDTMTPAVLGVLTQWLLRLPATYWLCHGLGYDALAAWWTMSLSTIVNGVLMAVAFWWRMRRQVPIA
jgi:MATE family multidrug resistance protein